jgi:hypothetical protein
VVLALQLRQKRRSSDQSFDHGASAIQLDGAISGLIFDHAL